MYWVSIEQFWLYFSSVYNCYNFYLLEENNSLVLLRYDLS